MEQRRSTMEEAEAQLYRRIQELRAQARGSHPDETDEPGRGEPQRQSVPDLRTILARAESHVDELRSTAATLEETLPARVERAVERAIAGQQGADPRQHEELRELMRGLARQIEQVNRDLLAERLGRVEDLELVVDLVSTGMAALRQDVATLAAHMEQIGGGIDEVALKLDQPLQVTVERPARKGVRDLFTRTDEPPAAS